MGIGGCAVDDDEVVVLVGGRLIVPWSSRRARPEGVWRRVGSGFGVVVVVGFVGLGCRRVWRVMGCDDIVLAGCGLRW